jgi:hypothetical protein
LFQVSLIKRSDSFREKRFHNIEREAFLISSNIIVNDISACERKKSGKGGEKKGRLRDLIYSLALSNFQCWKKLAEDAGNVRHFKFDVKKIKMKIDFIVCVEWSAAFVCSLFSSHSPS